ncbi:hypothetical protein ABE096_06415 [Robertmurraya massiliosenegalensis]
MQFKVIFEKKSALTILFLLMGIILINYFTNVVTYKGTDVIAMYHPMKLLTLSSFSEYSFYILQYFPLIVVMPAGFSLFTDKQGNQYIFIQSRVGAHRYYWGKLIVVFLVTFFIFTVPFLLEILLSTIAFPMMATGDPSNLSTYDASYMNTVNMYLLSDLYIYSPYIYAIFFTLIFGLFSGILAVFTVSISTFSIKYKVLLFLPVYLLLYFLGMLKQLFPTMSVETNYFFYLAFYHPLQNASNSLFFFILFALILLFLSILIVVLKIRKDT